LSCRRRFTGELRLEWKLPRAAATAHSERPDLRLALLAALIGHRYWTMSGAEQLDNLFHFYKNRIY
jgi:hypothetical protein